MPNNDDIWSVSRLNQTAQKLLEGHFMSLWLEGELSNFKAYSSGHWYFSLKDANAQVRGVMFRGSNQKVGFKPRDGQQVRVRARVSIYPPQGSFQLQVLSMQPAGTGALLAELERLKQQLKAEGLFDTGRKQPLPRLPRQIGVITSPSGAAFHDILQVLKRRCPQIPVVLYPARVQGPAAASELRQALDSAVTRNECDLLIIGRGGGSLEDLFCFNDAELTRAVANCPTPIISAVGHEVDFSLTDFAADARAATPSAAAELACPNMADWQQRCHQLTASLTRRMQQQLQQQRDALAGYQRRLISPDRLLLQHTQRLDELKQRLQRASDSQQLRHQRQFDFLQQRLRAQNPVTQLRLQQTRLQQLQNRQQRAQLIQGQDIARLRDTCNQYLQQLQHRFTTQLTDQRRLCDQLRHRLAMASPDNLLERGYSLTFIGTSDTLVRPDTPLAKGDVLTTRLAGKRLVTSRVEAEGK